MRRPFSRLSAISLGLILLAGGAPRAQQQNDLWPGFRGPGGDGVVLANAMTGAPDAGLTVAWKRPIGSGYSGISVGADIVVTMFQDGAQDVIAAFDPRSGAQRWRVPIGATYRGHDGSYDGPTSTPLIHEGLVIGLSPRGRLFALRAADGQPLWSIELTEELDAVEPIYGFATSPLIEAGTLIVQIGAPGAAVAGFDPFSGELQWTAGSDTITYQSPVPMTVAGRRQVLGVGLTEIFGIDPASGELLWRFEHGGSGFLGAESLVPVPAGDDRLFLAYQDSGSTAVRLDPNRPARNGEQLWESRDIRNSYSVAVYHDGYVYGFSSRFLAALDAATGESAWKSRPPGDGFPIVVGERLVVATKDGGVHAIEASPQGYRETASVQVFDDITWTPPSFALGSVWVRSMAELARVDIGGGERRANEVVYRAGEPPADSDFAAFLETLAQRGDKAAALNAYLAAQDSFPIVEGNDLVHFVYRGNGTDLALAGDLIGTRQETRMQRVENTDFFYYSAHLEPDARLDYRFIRDFEEILDPRNDRTTLTAFYRDDMELSYDGNFRPMSWFAMPEWRRPAHLAEPAGDTPRGTLVELSIDSRALREPRSFRVYLPPGYAQGDEHYPVVYYHGGFIALEIGEVPLSLDNLIAGGQQPVIAVFLPRPPYTGFSIPDVDAYDRYARMWAEEVVPMVDQRFRTLPTAGGRASVGGGSFGYIAAYSTFRQPGVADKLAIQSAAYNDWRRIVLEEMVRSAEEQPLVIYQDWGRYDARNPQENWDNRDKNRRLADFLRQRGYTPEGGEVNDGTGWPSWKNRTDRVLQTLFPNIQQ